jgi:hypothetical protein
MASTPAPMWGEAMDANVVSTVLARFLPLVLEHVFVYPTCMQAWEVHDPTVTA